jgi:hypothetical protein
MERIRLVVLADGNLRKANLKHEVQEKASPIPNKAKDRCVAATGTNHYYWLSAQKPSDCPESVRLFSGWDTAQIWQINMALGVLHSEEG